jgi:hypothetical protein
VRILPGVAQVSLLGGLFLLPTGLFAQGGSIDIATALVSKSGLIIRLVFTQNLAATGPQYNAAGAEISGTLAGTTIESSRRDELQTKILTMTLSSPLSGVSGVKVCFPNVAWTDANGKEQSSKNVCTTQLSTDVAAAVTAAVKTLAGVPKNSNEKNIFASGFVATGSGSAQGGGNISLNPDLGIPGMTSFLNINAASVAKGDSKVFNAGVAYQNVLPWGRADVAAMAKATTETQLSAALHNQQQRIFAGAVFELQAKLEGDPADFRVTNVVGQTDLNFQSRTRKIGNSKGYWRGFILPIGFEGGQNLSAGDITQPSATSATTSSAGATTINSVDHIARYLAGVNFTTFYEDWDSQLPFKRIELEINGLGRYLFLKEVMYNSSSKLFNTVGDGVRGYGSVDLKLYLGQNSASRYGINLTYAVGSLPPTFARVSTFQLGLLFETKDDTKKTK